MDRPIVGIIGGSGLYEIEGIETLKEVRLSTPFGSPSDSYVLGKLEGQTVAFLSRHGGGHILLPSEINYRANIFGFKLLGVEWVVSISAVGSMQEEIKPGDMVIPDQFIDWTKGRESTFFGEGIAVHVSMADPVCPILSEIVAQEAKSLGFNIHKGGTYLCIEGPQFSSRAESNLYRSWGVSVIGMTNMPEAKLAREAEICYATLAMPTDYDCWHRSEANVTVDMVIETLTRNVENAKIILRRVISRLPVARTCQCSHVLENAVITDKEALSDETYQRLKPLLGRYLP